MAIARALEVSARVLILDEPTSSLTAHETENLFAVMRRLKSEDISIIFITHFLDQVYEVSDRITVLRNGKLVGSYDTDSLARVELVARMIGRDLAEFRAMDQLKEGHSGPLDRRVVLEAREFGLTGAISHLTLICTREKSSALQAYSVQVVQRPRTFSSALTNLIQGR